jgi:hypothetical protein
MAIDVTCPGCHTRFQVSEKFAGKSGPCPKCKVTIKIPEKSEQVVIHAPEEFGPKGASGQAIFKPIARTDLRLGTPQIVAIVGSVLAVIVTAVVLRVQFPNGNIPLPITILGAILLGPPLAFAAYTFLRDDEIEPFRGSEVLLRSLACGLVYAAIWGGYWFVFSYFYNWKPLPAPPNWQLMCAVVPIMIGIGAFAAQASFELELSTGAMHYSVYLIATVLLRVMMGMDPRWMT